MKRRTSSILVILVLEALLATLFLADAADDPAIRLPTDSTSVEDMVEGVGPRPWKCCDIATCTKSDPPTCFCRDKVKRCSLACKKCERVSLRPRLYQCMDSYFGYPGPKCTKNDEEYVPSSNPVGTDVEEIVEEVEVLDGGRGNAATMHSARGLNRQPGSAWTE